MKKAAKEQLEPRDRLMQKRAPAMYAACEHARACGESYGEAHMVLLLDPADPFARDVGAALGLWADATLVTVAAVSAVAEIAVRVNLPQLINVLPPPDVQVIGALAISGGLSVYKLSADGGSIASRAWTPWRPR